jgi:hypothetical protein
MSGCQVVNRWMRESVAIPVMQALTSFIMACHEYRQMVEREVSRPMEQWVEQAQQVCNSWPWPFDWLCSVVVAVIRVVVWVVEVILEWVVSIVCEIIAVIVQVIVQIIFTIIQFLVSFFVCMFTDGEGWLNSFYDLYTNLLNVVEGVINLVTSILSALASIIDSLGSLLENVIVSVFRIIPGLGDVIGRILGGIIRFIFHTVRRLVEIVRDVITHLQDIVFGLLRGDLCRLASGALDLLTDIGQVILVVLDIPLGWAGSIGDSFDQDVLAGIIDERLVRAFAGRPADLQAARNRIRIHSRPLGLPIYLNPQRFYLNSRSTMVDLRDLHTRNIINLYTAAGEPNACDGRTVFDSPRWEVVYAGTTLPVVRRDIDTFLRDGPLSVPEFRVYSIRVQNFERYLQIAHRKGREIGLDFTWGRISDHEITRADELPIPLGGTSQDPVLMQFNRTGTTADNFCEVPVLAIHKYDDPTLVGLTSWFRPPSDVHPSGVSFRDRVPVFVFQWTLIHELGHYFGLNHVGHDGLENIMYTARPSEMLSWITWGTFPRYFLTGEPRFTLQDAREVWDWLTSVALDCVRGQSPTGVSLGPLTTARRVTLVGLSLLLMTAIGLAFAHIPSSSTTFIPTPSPSSTATLVSKPTPTFTPTATAIITPTQTSTTIPKPTRIPTPTSTPAPPVLQVTPGKATEFCANGGYPTTFTVKNIGAQTLTWSVTTPTGVTASPASGILTVGASQIVTLSGLYSGHASFTLEFTSNGGQQSVPITCQ